MNRITLLVATALLAACSGISVTRDWDPNVDFSQFRTFAVLQEQEQPINQLTDRRIRGAIVADLASKGLRQVDTPAQADLAIGYLVTTDERTTYMTVHSGWVDRGFGYSHVRRGGRTAGTSRTTQHNYTVGTLVIAVFEMGNNDLVWEASGSRLLTQPTSPEQSEQRINDVIQRIMQDFPPTQSLDN